MKIKEDWKTYLHRLREREINIIFKTVPRECFNNGLEIGGGDGFQSDLISNFTKHLTCTDINYKRLKKQNTEKIIYKICDAEHIDRFFEPESFDLVFLSNVLEHLLEKEKFLRKVYKLLKNEGVLVTVVPNTFLKFCWILFFYPNQIFEFIEIVTKKNRTKNLVLNIKKIFNSKKYEYTFKTDFLNLNNYRNNLKSKTYVKYFFPSIHGEYNSHFKEFCSYSQKEWRMLLENNGYELENVLKMPFTSGYGFGFDSIRRFLEKLKLSSSYAFITFKKKSSSIFKCYWSN